MSSPTKTRYKKTKKKTQSEKQHRAEMEKSNHWVECGGWSSFKIRSNGPESLAVNGRGSDDSGIQNHVQERTMRRRESSKEVEERNIRGVE